MKPEITLCPACGRPGSERWRCAACSMAVADEDICEPDDAYEELHHLTERGMPCGPVVEEVSDA